MDKNQTIGFLYGLCIMMPVIFLSAMMILKKASNPAPIKASHRQRGFTLIELMIVIAIIGILSAVAVPLFKEKKAPKESDFVTCVAGYKFNKTTGEQIKNNMGNGITCETSQSNNIPQ